MTLLARYRLCGPRVPTSAERTPNWRRKWGSAPGPLLNHGQFLFDTIANFTHNFFKPFAVTFDYLDMNLCLT